MKNVFKLTIVGTIFLILFSGCRPKDLEGAFVHFNASRYDQALPLAEKVTKEHPNNSEGWFLLGVLYGKKDQIKDMNDAFDRSLQIDATHKNKIENEKNSYFASKFNSGANLFNKYIGMEDRASEKAIKTMEQSLKSFEDVTYIKKDYRAFNLIAQGNLMLGRKAEAKKQYLGMTEMFPDSANAWIALGKFYYETKEYDIATKNFEKAVALDENNAEGLTFLAQTYDFLNQPEKAIPAYKKAIEANQNDSAIPFNLGLLLYKSAVESKGSADAKAEKLTEAIGYFAQSIDINPEFKSSYQLKGNAELLTQKYEDAKETLEEGVDIFPDDSQMWEDLARCYALLNEKEKAEAADQKARDLKN